MPVPTSNQIPFRYRAVDSMSGVTRKTTRRLAAYLGVDETQAIHFALREFAVKVLPQYEADDGPLTAAQMQQLKRSHPQRSKNRVALSSLIGEETA
ncbi:MAG: hypothetical protein LBP94_03135 [Zoogloeaceae bacterium]|jgi:hypothetical protein|nr:hypothetical protein [Zoogloeaceae bacterium]